MVLIFIIETMSLTEVGPLAYSSDNNQRDDRREVHRRRNTAVETPFHSH